MSLSIENFTLGLTFGSTEDYFKHMARKRKKSSILTSVSSADEKALSPVPVPNYMVESLSPKQLMKQPGSNFINCQCPFNRYGTHAKGMKTSLFHHPFCSNNMDGRVWPWLLGVLQTSYNKKYVNVLPNIKPCQSLINGMRQ